MRLFSVASEETNKKNSWQILFHVAISDYFCLGLEALKEIESYDN